jgi:hypothetical protein
MSDNDATHCSGKQSDVRTAWSIIDADTGDEVQIFSCNGLMTLSVRDETSTWSTVTLDITSAAELGAKLCELAADARFGAA